MRKSQRVWPVKSGLREPAWAKRLWCQVHRLPHRMEDMLCFSTDYPHLTFDDPNYIARQLPDEWHRKIFFENGCELMHWEADAKVAFGNEVAVS